MACPHLDVRRRFCRRGSKLGGKPKGFRSIRGLQARADRTGESLEPSLMPREAEPRSVGCWSGVQGLAAEKRQAPAKETTWLG